MFADYKTLVIRDYQRKKRSSLLPLSLVKPSPAELKELCKAICNERFTRKDEKALKAFFGNFSDMESCLKAIDRFENDRLKPLANFLEGRTSDTKDKNIEVLAWLIDFEPRPYEFGRKYDATEPSQTDPVTIDPGDGAEQGSANGTAPPKAPTINWKKLVISSAAAFILLAGFYWLGANKPTASIIIGHQACMYWHEDHYEPISCQDHADTLVVALDSSRLTHFRKITRPDTITAHSIGKIWYARYRKDYEFYTSDGLHPMDPNLRLRPLTEYIIAHHIRPAP